MNIEIKFRSWDKGAAGMHPPMTITEIGLIMREQEAVSLDSLAFKFAFESLVWMQFTGFHLKGKELYEGDILRLEESTDTGTEFMWLVITWVKEWGMFATMRTDEYREYLKVGKEALDEPLFWTYTLEDTDNVKYFLCGNIFQTPELLEK